MGDTAPDNAVSVVHMNLVKHRPQRTLQMFLHDLTVCCQCTLL